MNLIVDIMFGLISLIVQISEGIFLAVTIFLLLPIILIKIFSWLSGNREKTSKKIFHIFEGKLNHLFFALYFIGFIALLIPIIFYNHIDIDWYSQYFLFHSVN